MKETPLATDEQDRALVERYLENHPEAADTLVDRYQQRLFNVAFRMLGNVQDAEDVTQTVFFNVFRKLRTYDPRYKFFSWIYRMAVNESLNLLKRRKPAATLDDDLDIAAPGSGADSAAQVEDQVTKALQSLNPDDRAVVILKHFMSFTYEEIAAVLEIPVQTVKSRLFTARDRLRLAIGAGVR